MPVTILDLAIYRGALPDAEGYFTGESLARVGLDLFGGCSACGAVLAAYNACPTWSGYWMCARECVGEDGYATVSQADAGIFGRELACLVESPFDRTEEMFRDGRISSDLYEDYCQLWRLGAPRFSDLLAEYEKMEIRPNVRGPLAAATVCRFLDYCNRDVLFLGGD